MVSSASIVTGSFIILLSLPFLVFPRRAARLRYRYATNPEPTDAGIQEARIGGVLLFLFGLWVVLFN